VFTAVNPASGGRQAMVGDQCDSCQRLPGRHRSGGNWWDFQFCGDVATAPDLGGALGTRPSRKNTAGMAMRLSRRSLKYWAEKSVAVAAA
jgi:hypothetical protein